MGDVRRFDVFARFIASQIPERKRKDLRVADVAAGKGYLSFALREHGFRCITPFEPSPRKGGQVRRLGIQVRNFEGGEFDLIVGMHPDEATDVILDVAAKTKARAIVVPCCVRPVRWTFWGNQGPHRDADTNHFRAWVTHLKRESDRRGLRLNEALLEMTGRNVVLWN